MVSIKAETGSYNHAESWLQDVEGAIAVDHCYRLMYRWLLSLHGYYVIEGNCFNLSECTYTYRNYIFCSIWYRQRNQGGQWGTCLQQSSKSSGACLVLQGKDYTGCLKRASRNTSTIPTSDNKCGQSLQCEVHQVVVRYRDW